NSVKNYMSYQQCRGRSKTLQAAFCHFEQSRAGFPFAIGGELSAILLWRRFGNASRKLCCTAIMKGQTSKNWHAMLVSVLWTRLTLENWRAKLISLVLATTVWYLIKKTITTTASSSEGPSPTPVTETR